MTQYNQTSKSQHVRVGNWFEELKLKEDTGERFFPPQQDKKSTLLSKDRCITHTDQVQPKNYKSVTQETIVDPKLRPEYHWRIQREGPRSKLLFDKIQSVIANENKETALKEARDAKYVDYTTENKAKFVKDFKTTLQSTGSGRVLPSVRSDDAPVTFYSDTVKRGVKVPFPTTFVGAENPFAKNGGFSADYSRHEIAKRGESFEHPQALPTVNDYQNLSGLRRRLIKVANEVLESGIAGRAIRDIVGTLWQNYDNLDGDKISPNKLSEALQLRYGISLSIAEKVSLVSSFGDEYDNLSLPNLTNWIRRKVSNRRMELINFVFNVLVEGDRSSSATLSRISDLYRGDINALVDDLSLIRASTDSPLGSDEFSADDIFDYYIDVSSEIEEDQAFEDYLTCSWVL